MPLLAGLIRDTTASLEWAWACLLGGMLLVLLMTWKLKQPAAQQTIEGAAGAVR
jgi:CP family cyanate transporter-like MFS transporter